MSNKLRKPIKNLHVPVIGAMSTGEMIVATRQFDVIITNDELGRTISINNGSIQFTIPFEPIEKYLK